MQSVGRPQRRYIFGFCGSWKLNMTSFTKRKIIFYLSAPKPKYFYSLSLNIFIHAVVLRKKIIDLVKFSFFCVLLKFQKLRQNGAVFGSPPSSKWHGYSHVAQRNVMHFRELDALFSLFAVPKFTSQSMTAQARPRFPIARYWIKLSSHSRGHKKSRISPNQKTIVVKYSRK